MDDIKNDFQVLQLNYETLIIFKECFDNNGSAKNIENIKWLFFDNPTKKCLVDIAFDTKSNKAAGIYALSCIDFKIESKIKICSQSLDTITDSDFRGKGLFTNLARSVYRKANNTNISLVYGFPNGNSIHGFTRKLEWEVLDPVPFLIKPLKSKFFFSRIPFFKFLPNFNLLLRGFSKSQNFIVKESFSFPPEVSKIWEIFSKDIKVAVNRNKDYLDWRYINKPYEDYRIVLCYDNLENLLGFIVFCIKDKHKGKVAYVMELIYNLEYPKAANQLLNYAIQVIKNEDADVILSWCFEHSPNYRIFKNSWFFKLPQKIRPIELHFGVRAFDYKLKNIIYNRENWYISYSDSDTV